jgi:4-hydroxy-tetrahydrodipicolinate synthase
MQIARYKEVSVMTNEFLPAGTIPANLLPFTEDLDIDEDELRRHLSWIAAVPGVTAIVQNGHAAEVSSLTREEKKRVLSVTLSEVGDRLPIIAGVDSDGSLEAAQLAKDAKGEGARAVLILPPVILSRGGELPEAPEHSPSCQWCANIYKLNRNREA